MTWGRGHFEDGHAIKGLRTTALPDPPSITRATIPNHLQAHPIVAVRFWGFRGLKPPFFFFSPPPLSVWIPSTLQIHWDFIHADDLCKTGCLMCLENPQKRCKVLVSEPVLLFVWSVFIVCLFSNSDSSQQPFQKKQTTKKRSNKTDKWMSLYNLNYEPNGLKTFQMICIAASAMEEPWLQTPAPDDYEWRQSWSVPQWVKMS